MKESVFINDTMENRISQVHLAAFLVSLPLDRFYSQLILISFILHTLIHTSRARFRSMFEFRNLVLSSVLIISLLGILWSPEPPQALKDVTRQLAIVLFPVAFALSNFPFYKYRRSLLMVFGFTCTITILYLYFDAFRIILYNKLPLTSIFSLSFINHNFSSGLEMHATYLSLYVALAFVFFVWTIIEEGYNRKTWLFIVSTIILAVGLIQLASKSVLVGLIIAVSSLPLFMPAGFKRTRFIMIALLVVMIAILGILNIDSFRRRLVAGLKQDLTQAAFTNEILEPRAVRWELAWNLIRKKPILGYGSGTEKTLLKDQYFNNRLFNSYLFELNAHSQYLSFWIKTGILGLVLFLATLLYGFYIAWKRRDPVFFSFVILVSIVCFSENMLDVNKGIFFYAFFFSFFVYAGKPFSIRGRLE